jgi:ATP-binding cassette subfamily B protein
VPRLDVLAGEFSARRIVQARHQAVADVLSALFRNVVTLGPAAVLMTVAYRFQSGEMTVGELALFLTYTSWLSEQIWFFGRALARYADGRVAHRRLVGLFPEPGPAPAAPGQPLERLQVVELARRQGATFQAQSFAIDRGQIIVVTGEVGAGKSTLLRCLLGLERPEGGRLLWNGTEITGALLSPPRAGYTSDAPGFVSGTVEENLLLGEDPLDAARLHRALEAVQLRPGSDELPLGLSTSVGAHGSALSGGQRQRLGLARMLCRPADLYVVDSADSSLDEATARAMWEALFSGWSATWIIVSHHPYVLSRADLIIKLGGGR